MAPISALAVAEFFIWKSHEVGDPITNLKLQKLAYYAQAWHLTVHKTPLVSERFEAWVHGPVCRELYAKYKVNGSLPIPNVSQKPALAPEVEQFLEEVFEVYGGFSAWDLERLVHQERPWLAARTGLSADEAGTRPIDHSEIANYYGHLLVEAKPENS